MYKTNKFLKLSIIILLISPLLFLFYSNFIEVKPKVILEIDLNSTVNHEFQLYYYNENENEVNETYSDKIELTSEDDVLRVSLPPGIKGFRFDLGQEASEIVINSISFHSRFNSSNFNLSEINNIKSNELKQFNLENNKLVIETFGADPYIFIDFEEEIQEVIMSDGKIVVYWFASIITVITLIPIIILILYRHQIIKGIIDNWNNRNLIFKLMTNDFKTKYAGSYFGVLWAFVQPLMTILVFWFVFEVGFRSGPVEDVPFILWLIAGMVPWFFFAESWGNATNSYIEYNYLVKKIKFKINILPLVKIGSAFYVHLFFVVFTILLYLIYNISPTIYWMQLAYYTLCAVLLSYAFSLVTSALVIFFRDLGQILSLILQMGMWVTPVLWKYTMVPETYIWLLKVNPAFYLVEGYRDSLIYETWFWENFNETIYFWLIVILVSIIGVLVNRKLRPHFADVL